MSFHHFRLATPVAPEPTGIDHGEAVQAQLNRELYERGSLATGVMLVLIVLMRWAIDPACRADPQISGLFMALIIVNVVRLLITFVPTARRDALCNLEVQYLIFATGVGLSATLMGILVVMSWPLLQTVQISILAIIIIISGLFSGAVLGQGISLLLYMLYMVPSVGALFMMAMTDQRPPWGADILATLFVIYALAVLVISIEQQRNHRRAIEDTLKLNDLAVRDTLTNLHNRRFLKEFMTLEAARISREIRDQEQGREPTYHAAVGLFMVDLDHFKRVNDTHGHPAGDALLKQTAEALSSAVRHSDIVVRWGGEEFLVIARSKERSHISIVAEKLRAAVESLECKLPNGRSLHNTCSVGYCMLPFFPTQPRLLKWEEVLGMADAALMVAKTEGRNRWAGVVCPEKVWDDPNLTYIEVISDVKIAAEKGFIKLERCPS